MCEESIMHVDCDLDRRALLSRAMLIVGATSLPVELWSAAPKKAPHILTQPQFTLASAVADTLIPKTDTPGALAADVPAKFDALLGVWASASRRAQLLAALDAINQAALTATQKPFAVLAPKARYVLLTSYDATNLRSNPHYAKLRELMVVLYYLSEIGSTVELRYEHVPGGWWPSLPVTPASRASGGAAMY
jgi:hypothetical protein